jgi:NAD(P)-dependent dehydrogenase (short-subunit alcohol dehydrogenase family)
VRGDGSNLANLDRLFTTLKQQEGRLDVLFANAAIVALAPLGSIAEEHFDKVFTINVKGLLFTVQKALPLFTRGETRWRAVVGRRIVSIARAGPMRASRKIRPKRAGPRDWTSEKLADPSSGTWRIAPGTRFWKKTHSGGANGSAGNARSHMSSWKSGRGRSGSSPSSMRNAL